jgi:hypothetical protein
MQRTIIQQCKELALPHMIADIRRNLYYAPIAFSGNICLLLRNEWTRRAESSRRHWAIRHG